MLKVKKGAMGKLLGVSPATATAPLNVAKTKGMQPRAGFGEEDNPKSGVQDPAMYDPKTLGGSTGRGSNPQEPRARRVQPAVRGERLQGGINEYGRQPKKATLKAAPAPPKFTDAPFIKQVQLDRKQMPMPKLKKFKPLNKI